MGKKERRAQNRFYEKVGGRGREKEENETRLQHMSALDRRPNPETHTAHAIVYNLDGKDPSIN